MGQENYQPQSTSERDSPLSHNLTMVVTLGIRTSTTSFSASTRPYLFTNGSSGGLRLPSALWCSVVSFQRVAPQHHNDALEPPWTLYRHDQ